MKYLVVAALAVLLGLTACSGGNSSDQNTQKVSEEAAPAAEQPTGAKKAIDAAKTAVAKAEQAQLAEGEEISVTGKLGCAHCTYHVTDSCAASIQTDEGAVYILDVAKESKWFQDRYNGARLEVKGKVHHEGNRVMLGSASITEL